MFRKQKKQPELEYKSVYNCIAEMICEIRRSGISNFGISLNYPKYFELEREIQSRQMYIGNESFGKDVFYTVLGVPIVLPTQILNLPVYKYTEDVLILTKEAWHDFISKKLESLGRIKEI